jgi:hypothetical protein
MTGGFPARSSLTFLTLSIEFSATVSHSIWYTSSLAISMLGLRVYQESPSHDFAASANETGQWHCENANIGAHFQNNSPLESTGGDAAEIARLDVVDRWNCDVTSAATNRTVVRPFD